MKIEGKSFLANYFSEADGWVIESNELEIIHPKLKITMGNFKKGTVCKKVNINFYQQTMIVEGENERISYSLRIGLQNEKIEKIENIIPDNISTEWPF